MRILIIIQDLIYDVFNIIWLLIKLLIDMILFYISKSLCFICRLDCDGCNQVYHKSTYTPEGHYIKRYWCTKNRKYMIYRCYRYRK